MFSGKYPICPKSQHLTIKANVMYGEHKIQTLRHILIVTRCTANLHLQRDPQRALKLFFLTGVMYN